MKTKLCEDDRLLIATITQHCGLVDYEADCATIGLWKDNPLVRAAWERAKEEKEATK